AVEQVGELGRGAADEDGGAWRRRGEPDVGHERTGLRGLDVVAGLDPDPYRLAGRRGDVGRLDAGQRAQPLLVLVDGQGGAARVPAGERDDDLDRIVAAARD